MPASRIANEPFGHVPGHPIGSDSHAPVFIAPAPYFASPFGSFRAGPDLVVRDNIHLYPGVATAYDTDLYGFEQTNGTATHVPDQSAIRLALTGTASGDKSRLRSHDHVLYQSGAATALEITGYQSNSGRTNQSRRFGIFDDSDGVFFETFGTTNYLTLRTSTSGSPVDTRVAQANWNVDEYPGLDVTKGNRYRFVIAWLGVEGVQCFINGRHVHTFSFSNSLAAPYMKTANLPISVEIVNSGVASGTGSLTYICSSARILNGGEYASRGFAYSLAASGVAATVVPLFSMRVKSTLNTVASRVQILPRLLTFFAETQPGAVVLLLNPTLTGSSFAATSPSPAVEIDTAASATTGGTELFRTGQGANTVQNYDLSSIFSILGLKLRCRAFGAAADILTIGVVREGAVSFGPRATLAWAEFR